MKKLIVNDKYREQETYLLQLGQVDDFWVKLKYLDLITFSGYLYNYCHLKSFLEGRR